VAIFPCATGSAAAATRQIEANQCFINSIVLCELVWVLDAAYGYDRQEIAAVIEKILTTTEFEIENADYAWAALRDYRNTKADFADCLIAHANRTRGCEKTISFDKGAAALSGFAILPDS
jgi:predicted nucleic-acid-binding protein